MRHARTALLAISIAFMFISLAVGKDEAAADWAIVAALAVGSEIEHP